VTENKIKMVIRPMTIFLFHPKQERKLTMSDHEESSTGKQQFSPISHPPSLSPDRTHVPRPPPFPFFHFF
jgi:hypothetical protein